MKEAGASRTPHPDAIQHALLRVFRPVIRLAIRCGVTFPALADLIRQIYVNVAEQEFALAGKSQTDSRVSLLTGVHRKEVSRLRRTGTPVAPLSEAVSRSDAIIARWLASPEFTDERGIPLPLPRAGDPGTANFDMLVESVTRDVRPRAVLDDWLDRGLVRLDEDQRVVLTESAIVPRGDDTARLRFFALNLHDHMAAAVDNVLSDQPPFFERSVHYDGLSADLARELERHGREIAMQTLLALNRRANVSAEQDPGGTSRWNLGIYVYRTDAADPVSANAVESLQTAERTNGGPETVKPTEAAAETAAETIV